MPVPDAFLNCPELGAQELFYSEAFWMLSNSRPTGFGVGYIPLSEIESYCRLFHIRDAPTMADVIRHMDRLFVDFYAKKHKAGGKGN